MHNLQQRVAELETALLSLSQRLESAPGTTESGNDTVKALQRPRSPELVAIAGPAPGAPLDHAPVLSLFDNVILSRRPDISEMQDPQGTRPPCLETKNGNTNPKLETIRQALLSLFPSQERQEAILSTSHSWWTAWQDMFPQIFGLESFSHVIQFIADLKASGNVQKIAKALLCLFVILQEGTVGVDIGHDMNAEHDTQQALSIIDEVILADDELAGTIDAVECMILRARYETNNGRVRRAWLAFRRGISFAQLLGLHKRQAGSENNANLSIRRESLWKILYTSDRLLSLLLGLPYGSSEIHSNVGRDSELSAKGIKEQNNQEQYLFRLATVVGHIVDRNQQLPSNNMLPLTFKIESEMMELAASMPDEWWKSGLEYDATANHMYSRFITQFWHYQARTLLHLPFMLKATTDRLFEYSKIATLESTREMLARYHAVRPAPWFSSLVCKVIDFQAFTGAMILVLNLMDHYRKIEAIHHREAEQDQGLITLTTNILRRASVEAETEVSTQAAHVLELFGNIKGMALPVEGLADKCTTKLVIPYFGTVVIGPGTGLRDHARARGLEVSAQPQQLPTPSDGSVDGSTPEPASFSSSSTAPMTPFGSHYNENTGEMNISGNLFTDLNFDLDQDWGWFWDNIDIPSVDLQGTTT